MTIQLKDSIFIAGVHQAAATSLTLGADVEAELVNRGVAIYVGGDPSEGGLTPAMMNAAGTALVDPRSGLDVATLGSNVITVGAGGMYATIQEAINAISGRTFFEQLNSTETTYYPTTATAWGLNSSFITVSSWLQIFIAEFDLQRTWLKLAGDSRLNRIQALNPATTQIYTAHPRIEATIGAAQAISYYREKPVTILLLDSTYSGEYTVNAPMSIRIDSVNRTTLYSGVTIGANASYGRVSFGGNINIAGNIFGSDSQSNLILEMEPGCSFANGGTDGSAGMLAELVLNGNLFNQNGATPLSHFFLMDARGDITVNNASVRFGVAAVNTPDVRLFDSLSARKFVVNGLSAVIDDPFNTLVNVWLFGQAAASPSIGDFVINNVHITSVYPSSANVYVMDEDTAGAGNITSGKTIALNNVSIGGNISGVKKLFKSGATSNSIVYVNDTHGGLVDTPSSGSVTYADTQSIAYAAAITPNLSSGNNVVVGTLTGNITVNAPLNPRKGQILTLNYTSDATVGRTITYNAVFKASVVPVSTANAKASHMFVYDGTKWIQTGGALVWL